MISEPLLILLLTLLASAMVIWYFVNRRRLVRFIKEFTVELERVFKPKDKTYHLLGYLVGYRAVYVLEDGSRAHILFTTAPILSLLYYPIAKLLKREHEVTITINPYRRKVACEMHAFIKGKPRLERVVFKDLKSRAKRLSRAELKSRWGVYEVYYEDNCDINIVLQLVNSSVYPIYKLSAYKDDNIVSLTSKADAKTLKELRDTLYRFMGKTTIVR
ncbi:MAG: hypothetical protein P3X22_002715 [Thermoprotei archaeon]|nr:hypothetical protein [Thermoprotei archaeon]